MTVWVSRAPATDGVVEEASAFAVERFVRALSALSGELIQSPMRSRRGLPTGSSRRSRMTASGFKSPTKRSVFDTAGKDGPADGGCARLGPFENDLGRSG